MVEDFKPVTNDYSRHTLSGVFLVNLDAIDNLVGGTCSDIQKETTCSESFSKASAIYNENELSMLGLFQIRESFEVDNMD